MGEESHISELCSFLRRQLSHIPAVSGIDINKLSVLLFENFDIKPKVNLLTSENVSVRIDTNVLVHKTNYVGVAWDNTIRASCYVIPKHYSMTGREHIYTDGDFAIIKDSLKIFNATIKETGFIEFLTDLIQLVKDGNSITSVKLFKDKTGLFLKESKVTMEYIAGLIICYNLWSAEDFIKHITPVSELTSQIKKELDI